MNIGEGISGANFMRLKKKWRIKAVLPEWFVMENIKQAPLPSVLGYQVDGSLLNNRWLGYKQNRVHRFSFGTRIGKKLAFEVALFEDIEWAARVCASGAQKPGANRYEQNKLRFHGWKTAAGLRESLFQLQGLPEDLLDEAHTECKKGDHSWFNDRHLEGVAYIDEGTNEVDDFGNIRERYCTKTCRFCGHKESGLIF